MKTYSELIKLPTFEERYRYLKLGGKPGYATFADARCLNQALYGHSHEWKQTRRDIIIRDNGCDLACPDRVLGRKVIVHHINPLTIDDVKYRRDCIFDPENLICVSLRTHNAIHFGDESLLFTKLVERTEGDTKSW